jgi:hypothetical protein
MLFNPVVFVVFHTRQSHHSLLAVRAHSLLIDIHNWVGVLNKITLLNESLQGVSPALIDFHIIRISFWWQINFRFIAVQK